MTIQNWQLCPATDLFAYYYGVKCRSTLLMKKTSDSTLPTGITHCILRSFQVLEKNVTSACWLKVVVINSELHFFRMQNISYVENFSVYEENVASACCLKMVIYSALFCCRMQNDLYLLISPWKHAGTCIAGSHFSIRHCLSLFILYSPCSIATPAMSPQSL